MPVTLKGQRVKLCMQPKIYHHKICADKIDKKYWDQYQYLGNCPDTDIDPSTVA